MIVIYNDTETSCQSRRLWYLQEPAVHLQQLIHRFLFLQLHEEFLLPRVSFGLHLQDRIQTIRIHRVCQQNTPIKCLIASNNPSRFVSFLPSQTLVEWTVRSPFIKVTPSLLTPTWMKGIQSASFLTARPALVLPHWLCLTSDPSYWGNVFICSCCLNTVLNSLHTWGHTFRSADAIKTSAHKPKCCGSCE